MKGQVSYEPLGPPAPQSYSECDSFRSEIYLYADQQRQQGNACDQAYVSGCGINTNCLAQNACHNCWPQHTQCGDIFYQGRSCGRYYLQAACTRQRGDPLVKQCYAEVQAFLQRQQAQETARQQAAAQEAAMQQSISSTVTTVSGLLNGNNRESVGPTAATGDAASSLAPSPTSAASSPRPNTSEYGGAYAVAASPDVKGVAEEWVKQKFEGSEHVFDAWKLAESATAFSELQSSEPADQAKGIGDTAKAVLDLHWGVYSPNQLSVEVSERSINVITNLAGQALSSLDQAMGTALSQISTSTASANNWDFNRTQAPIMVPYVAATPASVIALPTSNAQDVDQDVDIGQFLKTLETPR
jgi:hypothetical protein